MFRQLADRYELSHSKQLADVTAGASMEARRIISTYLDNLYGGLEEASEVPAKRASDFYRLCLSLATDMACRGFMLVKKENQQAECAKFCKQIATLVEIYNQYGVDKTEEIFDEIIEWLLSQPDN